MEMLMSTRTPPCGACKYQRRRCGPDCVFAPHFPTESIQKFACVHHVFGASNVGTILKSLQPEMRESAAKTLAYQAEARVRDPVHGCVGLIAELEERHRRVKEDLLKAQTELAQFVSPEAMREMCPRFGPSLKRKKPVPPPVLVELDAASFPVLCGDAELEKWDPFPPWGTFQKIKAATSSQMHEDKKRKSVAPPS
ncbi:LOB domain-containing protein 36 [Spatholobus suberectus]|nr:LOB domain-containing protein 36 [Spatholobus suberectus]